MFGIDVDASLSTNGPKIELLKENELIEFNDYLVHVFETYIEYHESFFDESTNFRQTCTKVREERRLLELLLFYFPNEAGQEEKKNEIRALFRDRKLPTSKT